MPLKKKSRMPSHMKDENHCGKGTRKGFQCIKWGRSSGKCTKWKSRPALCGKSKRKQLRPKHKGSKHKSSKRTVSKRTVSKRTVSKRTVSKRTGSKRTGSMKKSRMAAHMRDKNHCGSGVRKGFQCIGWVKNRSAKCTKWKSRHKLCGKKSKIFSGNRKK